MPQEVVSIEEEEEEQGDQGGASPRGEEDERGFLNVSGCPQTPQIHGTEAQATGQLEHRGFRVGAVAADQDLEGGDDGRQYVRASAAVHQSGTSPLPLVRAFM